MARIASRLAAAIVALLLGSGALAQTSPTQSGFPSKPIRLIVPFPPGAGTDAIARLVAQRIGEQLGTGGPGIVVDNRTGAGGAIGAEAVAKSAPDGYTLLFVASPFTTVAAASRAASYDPIVDFASVAGIAAGPLVFVAGPSLTARSIPELIAMARARPGVINYGSAGTASVNHLALELLRQRAGIDIVHIPYKGIGPASADLLGGQIETLTATIAAMLPHLRQGKVRALAVTGTTRIALLPEVPTMIEQGVPDYDVVNYWGIVAPARTPRVIIERLNAEIQQLLAAPALQTRLNAEGAAPIPGTPEKFSAFLRADLAKWRALIVEAGLKLD